MGRIHRLSDELVNQIAAGEVVERPASVVKELAENAIDAGATTVRVLLSHGGLDYIGVIDDGCGMSYDDALLCLERHATSKLSDADGLFHILTKGFRGEAIPSIASVSKFSLVTSEPGASSATQVSIEGGGRPVVSEAPAAGGTRVDVAELFFNVPARRKFLKRESTELSHCQEAVVRLALAHPEVSFFLEHDGKLLLASPAAPQRLEERIANLLGAEMEPHLLAVEERRLGFEVHGFVASPEYTLPTARGIYAFVNRRYVRDRGVNSAIQRAFQDALPPGRQPVCVLFLDVDPSTVDVNVHPQKLEVRFSDPRGIQEVLSAGVGRALTTAPWRQQQSAGSAEVHAHYAHAVEQFLSRAQEAPGQPLRVDENATPMAAEYRAPFGTAHPQVNEAPPPAYFRELRFVGELARRLWVCEGKGGSLVVIDPQAVRERLALHALRCRFFAGTLNAELENTASLFSTSFSAREVDALVTKRDDFVRWGIELEHFGGDTVVVKRVPHEVERSTVSEWLPSLVSVDDDEAALRMLAHAAGGVPMYSPSHEEVRALLSALDEVDFSVPSVRRRVVIQEMSLLSLVPGPT